MRKAEFVKAAQLAAVGTNLKVLFDWALRMWPLIMGALALLVVRLRKERLPGVRHIWAWHWLWPLAACASTYRYMSNRASWGRSWPSLGGLYGYLLPNAPVGIRPLCWRQ